MRYMLIFSMLLLCVNAEAQVGQITREGTKVFKDSGEVFTPNEQTIARQKMLQEQQVRQNANQGQQLGNIQEQKATKDIQPNTQKMKTGKSLLGVRGNQRTALNLLILQEVAAYKLDDETIKNDVVELENNQEYYRKLETIKGKLTNNKFPNSLNKEILRILDEAGNRLNNLLGN
ncbi:MAG: hypothetical protein IJ532_02655 [Alphaproteobacteria bacterium]|nr:hypothetical protein [Alphaproteobacteria bacterium]